MALNKMQKKSSFGLLFFREIMKGKIIAQLFLRKYQNFLQFIDRLFNEML